MESDCSISDGKKEKYLYYDEYNKLENASFKESVQSSLFVRIGRSDLASFPHVEKGIEQTEAVRFGRRDDMSQR